MSQQAFVRDQRAARASTLAPSGYLSMEYAPSVGRVRAVKSPSFTAAFFAWRREKIRLKAFLVRPDRALTTPAPVIAKKPCILRGRDGPANQP